MIRPARAAPGLRSHLVALVLAVLLPALVIGGAAAWRLALSYRQSFEARLMDTARSLALYLDSEIEAHVAAAAALASSPLLDGDDLRPFRDWAGGVGRTMGSWVAVNATEPGYRQVVNTGLPEGAPLPPPSPQGEGAWSVINQVIETGRPAVSDYFTGRATGRRIVAVAAPALRQGKVTRVVLLVVDPARLSDRLQALGLSGGAFASVTDSQGRIVARSRNFDQAQGMVPASRRVPEADRPQGIFSTRSIEGEQALYASQKLRTAAGWTLVVAEPYARYRASWLGPLAVLAAGAVVVMALGLAVAAWLARRILTPVRLLVDHAVAVAAGEGGVLPPAAPPARVAEFEALRVASEAAARTLEAREAEFRSIFETAAAGVVEIDARSRRYLRVNRRFCAISGRAEAVLVGMTPDDIAHPDDLGRNAVSEVLAHGTEAEVEVRLLRPDGAVVWIRASAAISARAPDGSPLRIVSVVRDVTERRRAEQARELLAREVDHRAKNALAVVQAVVRLTPKDGLDSYAKAVEARIKALARTHTLLANGRWAGTELASLARAELGAFLPDPARVQPETGGTTLAGPAVMLSPAASQAMSMVLHELATNATKYGALSVPGGAVHLQWSVDAAGGDLVLNWEERGGPPVLSPPARRGFGSKVIEATMRDQLGGEARQCWEPAGLVCRIRVPLQRILAGR